MANGIVQGVFFLSDNFETRITSSFLKISKFCKKVMNHENGPFDNLARKSVKYKWRKLEIHSKFTLFFTCNLLIRESKFCVVTNNWKGKGLISFEETLSVNINLSIRKPFYFR